MVLGVRGSVTGVRRGEGQGLGRFCASERDLAALNTRVLQTELMVAALSCGEKQRYNTFVTTYQTVLTDRGPGAAGDVQAGARRAGRESAERVHHQARQRFVAAGPRARATTTASYAVELFDEAMAQPPTELNRVVEQAVDRQPPRVSAVRRRGRA